MRRKHTKKQICEALQYWRAQLKKLDESKKMLSEADVKTSVSDAKREAKKITSREGVKKFLDSSREQIDELSSKLSGNAKKGFDKIVSTIEDYAKQKLDEAEDIKLKTITSLIALVMFLLHAPSSWVIAMASPVVGPLVIGALKMVPWFKEKA